MYNETVKLCYDETIKFWLDALLENCNKENVSELTTEEIKEEIEEIKGTIRNEHDWELGYDGDEPVNPHTENIAIMEDYIAYLEEMLEGRGDM